MGLKIMYKTLLLSLTLCLQNMIYSQANVFGYYVEHFISTRVIDLHSDSTFTFSNHPPCGISPISIAKGIWSLKNDTTLILSFEKGKIEDYYIVANGDLVDNYTTLTSFNIYTKETIVYTNFYLLAFERRKGYYSTGALEWEIVKINTKKANCIYYYPGGSIKGEGILKNKKRKGTWRYYKENGELDKKEFYRDNKLCRTKILS
jgi:hypothetical protein